MQHGYCDLNVVCAYAAPSFASEIVTQLLFADTFAVLDRSGLFLRIRMDFDGYESWIDARQCAALEPERRDRVPDPHRHVVHDVCGIARAMDGGGEDVLVMRGTSLPGYAAGQFSIAGRRYAFDGAVLDTNRPVSAGVLLDYARLYCGAPYMWGGRSPCGIDCSGFVQIVHKMAGIRLRRDTHQQMEDGDQVSRLAEAVPGDLVFAESSAGGHVGILMDAEHVIHASARVRIDLVTDRGIIRADTGQQSHWLTGIRRCLPRP